MIRHLTLAASVDSAAWSAASALPAVRTVDPRSIAASALQTNIGRDPFAARAERDALTADALTADALATLADLAARPVTTASPVARTAELHRVAFAGWRA